MTGCVGGAREDVAEHGMFGWEGPQLPTRSTRLCLAQGRLSTLARYHSGTRPRLHPIPPGVQFFSDYGAVAFGGEAVGEGVELALDQFAGAGIADAGVDFKFAGEVDAEEGGIIGVDGDRDS